ncbi:MAG TPA: YraN family protein [Anaerolineales bacterium]
MKAGKRIALGRMGESIAISFLEKQGYTILEKNYRTPYGEIDVISKLAESIIFVEVKTRASSTLGPPEISVTRRKAEHMRCAAEYYIQQHPELNNDWRVDVIAIQMQTGDQPARIEHFENVIQ